MSDPKATPSRGSKTAAVVMLVVFLQVLVVAVLGLTAISRDRQEARRQAEEQADIAARNTLDRILRRSAAEVETLLAEVEEMRSGLDLLRPRRRGAYADLIQYVYHVEPETRVVSWVDRDHLLYVPPEQRERLLRQAAEEKEAIRELEEKAAVEAITPDQLLRRIRKGIDLIRRYPYRQNEFGYPLSVGNAKQLVEEAQAVALLPAGLEEGLTAYVDLENALLAAVEVLALNRDRIEDLPRDDRPHLADLEDLVISVTTGLRGLDAEQPRIRSIRDRVEAYLAARHGLEGDGVLRDLLFAALKQRGPAAKLVAVGEDLLGLVPAPRDRRGAAATAVPDPDAGGIYALVLNPEVLKALIQDQAESARLQEQGLAFRLVSEREDRADDVVAARTLGGEAGLQIPYRAELLRTRPPSLPAEGPGELFYWGIILLAAGGLGMGAYVLSRLYTREVRLARLKADFVSNLSHELKTPLTSIGLFAEMLQDGQLQSEEDRKEGLDVLAQEAQRLQSIVARMLETARREARGVPYELQPGDLNTVVRKSVERFRKIVTEPGLVLDVQLHDGPMPMMLDAAALDDVVTNLLTNAWKYRQGDAAEIRVRTTGRGRKWEIVVDDDGIGISRRDRRRVFEMFYRSDAYLTKVAGTGLGLSLARTIVRAHKGRIRAEVGERGRGSRFVITFPIAKVVPRASKPSGAPVGSTPRTRSEAESTA